MSLRTALAACASAALFALGRRLGHLAGKLARRRNALVVGFIAGIVAAYEASEAKPDE
jgi:hypothetical protein